MSCCRRAAGVDPDSMMDVQASTPVLSGTSHVGFTPRSAGPRGRFSPWPWARLLRSGILLAGRYRAVRSSRALASDSRSRRATCRTASLKTKLAHVQAMRAFATRELGLPDNGSYTRYADVGRPFVVWNVFAAPQLSLDARQWCFPVAGCVAYRGLFRRSRRARRSGPARGRRLRRPCRRCSRLFDARLFRRSGVVDFHPLSRCRACAPRLSRARASARLREGRHLVQRILCGRGRGGGPCALADGAKGQPRRGAVRRRRGADTAHAQRLPLDDSHRARPAVHALRKRRIRQREAARAKRRSSRTCASEHERLKAESNGTVVFDRWFAGGANNAGIISAGLYADRVPQFAALLAEEHGDLPRFYERVESSRRCPSRNATSVLTALGAPDAPTTVAAPRL